MKALATSTGSCLNEDDHVDHGRQKIICGSNYEMHLAIMQ